MNLTQTYEVGDLIEVVNPKPIGARGLVVKDDGGPNVKVRWTDHHWGQQGQIGTPLRRLTRLVVTSTGKDSP